MPIIISDSLALNKENLKLIEENVRLKDLNTKLGLAVYCAVSAHDDPYGPHGNLSCPGKWISIARDALAELEAQ